MASVKGSLTTHFKISMTVPSTIIIVYTHLHSSTAIFWVGGGGAGVGSKAPLVPSLPVRIFNESGSLELQDLGPVFFLESLDLQVCGLELGLPPFFSFNVECVPDGVGKSDWKKRKHKKSRKRRPGTPASLLWSNMAEKLVDNVGKKDQPPKLLCDNIL